MPATPPEAARPITEPASSTTAEPAKKKEEVSNSPLDHAPPVPSAISHEPLNAENLANVWRAALRHLNDTTADMAGQFESIAMSGERTIEVRLPEQLRKFCARPERILRIEEALRSVTGQFCSVAFMATVPEGSAAVPKPAISRIQQMREIERHPLIQRAVDLFDGEVVDVWQGKPK
jgi:hypothetical protein